MSDNDNLLQVIKPKGFVATRFGFDSQLSTNTEQALQKGGVAVDTPAADVAQSDGGLAHA